MHRYERSLDKGSKFWIQLLINTQLSNYLNQSIDPDLEWLTPLCNQDNYSEYELNSPYITQITGIKKAHFGFWPSRQPQLDAIGINPQKRILYLVEAKAHIGEMSSKCSASNPKSKDLIEKSMRKVFDSYYPNGNFSKWLNSNYQLGNRFTFLHHLNEVSLEIGWEAHLVLINIVDDFTYKPTTLDEWKKHYKNLFEVMFGLDQEPQNVKTIFSQYK